jgi:glycosyltransferase involved in cell wall biosynthesis
MDRLETVPSLRATFLPVNPRLRGPFGRLQEVRYVRTAVTTAAYVGSLLRSLPRCDVLHAFSASYWSFLLAPALAMVVGRMLGKRVVLNYHSGEAEDHLRRWGWHAIPLMRLAHAIVVPSGYLREVFAQFGLTAEPIANFVDVEHITFRLRGNVQPRFLSNRNLEAMYNVACTLNAFAIIQREVPHAALTIVGSGTEEAALKALADELSLQHVRFVGSVLPETMNAYYDEADVYLNASDVDNMPLSILEAQAAGLPVVSTRAGGIPFVVRHGETGLLVSRGDARALAVEALRLVRDSELAGRLSAAGRKDVLARYTWNVVQTEWEQLYHSLTRTKQSEDADGSSATGHTHGPSTDQTLRTGV